MPLSQLRDKPYADELRLLRYGGYLGFNGDLEAALAEVKEARRLEPLSPDVNASLGTAVTVE